MTFSLPDSLLDEVHYLTLACLGGDADSKDVKRLETLLLDSKSARRVYLRAIHDSYSIRRRAAIEKLAPIELLTVGDSDVKFLRLAASSEEVLADVGVAPMKQPPEADEPVASVPSPVVLIDPASSVHSSPFDLQSPFGAVLSSYGLAAVFMALMLLGAWSYKISHDSANPHIAGNRQTTLSPSPVFVAQITGMKDCCWAKPDTQTILGASVSLEREYALSSGLMEITYTSGAKVILEGPCIYKVDSDAGGYLTLGKLTARIDGAKPQAANHEPRTPNPDSHNSSHILHLSSFVVTTPTAIITDLGTEFGVDVNKDGSCEVHLIEGKISAKSLYGESKAITLTQNQGVMFVPNRSEPVAIGYSGDRFQTMRERIIPKRILHWPIADKTLVAWVSLADLDRQGGGVVSIEENESFDGIVYSDDGKLSENAKHKWLTASNGYCRTQEGDNVNAEETAGPNELVQIAIVYRWNLISIYRNGREYARYYTTGRQLFGEDSVVLMGKRCVDRIWRNPPHCPPTLTGEIEEVRIYDVPLSAESIASLKLNESLPINPVGRWTFEDGTASDATGNFPMGELRGNARIADGKLILDGEDSYLFIPAAADSEDKSHSGADEGDKTKSPIRTMRDTIGKREEGGTED